MEIAKLVLQAIAVFVAVFSLCWTILSAWRKKQEQKIARALSELRDDVETATKKVSAEICEERSHRVDNINRLHARIDDMQADLLSDLQGRMSRMEGELKGMTNILSQIQGWFIDQANRSSKG